jgi:hypothetical protein
VTRLTRLICFFSPPRQGFPRATPDATRSLTHSRCIPARIASRTAQITTPDQWATLRLFVSSWIVRHEKGMTRVGARHGSRQARVGDHHEQGSRGTGEYRGRCNPNPRALPQFLITIINLPAGFSPCKRCYSHVTLDVAGRHEWQQQRWFKVTVRGWKFHLEVT